MIPPFLMTELHKLVNVNRRPAIGPDAELASLGLDPLDSVTLACAVEEHLGVELSDHEIEAWQTVGDILASVERRRRIAA